MEFLVRLDDKINIQVFCFNPVHRGNHMNRVFYKDDTFNAPCPECESSKYLYRKNNAITKKGHFVTFKPDGWGWGTNERKHYGIIRIDSTEEQASAWCEGIRNEQAEADVKKHLTDVDKEKLRLAENRVQIDYRPRKYKLDFDSVLSTDELKNWNDKGKFSKVIENPIISMETI